MPQSLRDRTTRTRRRHHPMTDFNQSPKLQLLPAIDVADGKAVRLTQGGKVVHERLLG